MEGGEKIGEGKRGEWEGGGDEGDALPVSRCPDFQASDLPVGGWGMLECMWND